jgi:hypothetical protein
VGLGLLAGEAVLEGGYAAQPARHELADAAGINRDGDDERHGLVLHRDDGIMLAIPTFYVKQKVGFTNILCCDFGTL